MRNLLQIFRFQGSLFGLITRSVIYLGIGLALSVESSAQIVTVLKGESCLDEATLNDGDPPEAAAHCQSWGVCRSDNPFAGIAIVVASDFRCTGTPVINFAASNAKVGGGITANAAATSLFFGRRVGVGFGNADCITGINEPTFRRFDEGCFATPPGSGFLDDPCLGGSGPPDPGSFTGGGGTIDPNCSPIIVDTEGEGFHLTSAADGVLFDISGDGQAVKIAWTDPRYHNAFLALDRNGNGKIDGGAELFGNFTQQPKSEHPNGFLALAEFDKPENGGNGDGVIDERDAVFPKLKLWIDTNHDGISQPEELHSLKSLGINSISLGYQISGRTDRFGNNFRYRAKLESADHTGRWAYDVFLTAQ